MTVDERSIAKITEIVIYNEHISHDDLYKEFRGTMSDPWDGTPCEHTDILYRNFCDFVDAATKKKLIERDTKTLAYKEGELCYK